MPPFWWRVSYILNSGGFYERSRINEVACRCPLRFTAATSGVVEHEIERLEADNATRDQILSMLKSWISARQKIGTQQEGAAK